MGSINLTLYSARRPLWPHSVPVGCTGNPVDYFGWAPDHQEGNPPGGADPLPRQFEPDGRSPMPKAAAATYRGQNATQLRNTQLIVYLISRRRPQFVTPERRFFWKVLDVGPCLQIRGGGQGFPVDLPADLGACRPESPSASGVGDGRSAALRTVFSNASTSCGVNAHFASAFAASRAALISRRPPRESGQWSIR